jgi:hypothetical protein
VINALIVLLCVNFHVIAGLKVADLCGAAGIADVFSRVRRDGCDRLVVGLDDDIFVADAPQYAVERGLIVGLIVGLSAARRISRTTALRIPPAARIPTTGIAATGVSAAGNDDLAKAGNAGQQENDK